MVEDVLKLGREAACSLPSAFCRKEASGRMCRWQAEWGPSWQQQLPGSCDWEHRKDCSGGLARAGYGEWESKLILLPPRYSFLFPAFTCTALDADVDTLPGELRWSLVFTSATEQNFKISYVVTGLGLGWVGGGGR